MRNDLNADDRRRDDRDGDADRPVEAATEPPASRANDADEDLDEYDKTVAESFPASDPPPPPSSVG